MKKIFAVMLLTVLFVFAPMTSGCTKGSYVVRNCVRSSSASHISMRYEYFDGTILTRFTVKEGQTRTMQIEAVSDSGKLTISVTKEGSDAEAAFYEEDIQTGSDTVTLSEPGKYTVKTIGQKHKGSYKISW